MKRRELFKALCVGAVATCTPLTPARAVTCYQASEVRIFFEGVELLPGRLPDRVYITQGTLKSSRDNFQNLQALLRKANHENHH